MRAQILRRLLLLACLAASAAARAGWRRGEEEEDDDEAGEGGEGELDAGPGSFRLSTSLLGIVTTLVVVTIVFEFAKEHIIESVSEQMRPVVSQAFSELTVLGFLSLCTFLISKAGVLDTISKHVFCGGGEEGGSESESGSAEIFGEEEEGDDEECEEEMSELFESCHMLLFGVMVLFILQVLNLLRIGKNTERAWSAINKQAQDRAVMGYCTRAPITNPSAYLEHLRHEDGQSPATAGVTAEIAREQEVLQAHADAAKGALAHIDDPELHEACVAAVRNKVREHAAERKAERMSAITAPVPGVCGTSRTCIACLNERFQIQDSSAPASPAPAAGGSGSLQAPLLEPELDEAAATMQDIVTHAERFPRRRVQEAQVALDFQALRAEFVRPRNNLPPYEQLSGAHNELPQDFDYAKYLSMCLGRELAEVVELPVSVWLALEGLVVVYWALMLAVPKGDAFEVAMMVIWLCFGVLLMLVTLALRRKVLWIKQQLFPSSVSLRISDRLARSRGTLSSRGRGRGALGTGNSQRLQTVPSVAQVPAPAWTQTPVPDPATRSPTRVNFMGKAPNAHEMLFWFEAEGPEFHLFVVRMLLVLLSVYVALMAFQFTEYANRQWGAGGAVAYVVLALLPVGVIALNISTLVTEVVHVSVVGLLRRPQVIKDVVRIQKTEKALKSLRLLSQMKHRYTSLEASGSGDGNVELAEGNIDLLEPAQKEHLIKTFRQFDSDGSGEVDAQELRTMMASLGQQMTDDEADRMLEVLDTDGDGTVSLQEFLSYNAAQLADPVDISPDELAHSMFKMFDEDGSGSIGIGEFVSALNRFGCTLSVDEVADLVRELDEDGDGEISEHEFADLLRRHAVSDLV